MLGEAFRIVRVFNDMTQQEIASEVGISHSYLSQIESGKRTPTMDVISKFSSFFGIPVSALIFFSEQLGRQESEADRASRLRFGRRLLTLANRVGTDDEDG